jgi:long-chain acyl-CoA synthetase
MAMSHAEVVRTLTAPGAPYEMEERLVLGQRLRCWKNVPPTLRALVESIPRWGDRTYLVYEDDRITYAEAHARVCALACWLVEDAGVKKGDRVAIAMRNYLEWPLCFWAAVSVGAIAVPLNGWWTGPELAYGLRDSGTRVLFADDERAERAAPHLAGLPVERVVVVRARGPLSNGWLHFEDLVPAGATVTNAPRLPDATIEPDDDATIFYTSGTTGEPKGALGTHLNMCTNIGSSNYGGARALLRKGLPLPDPNAPAPQGSILLSVPLFHVTGSHSTLAVGTWNGAKIVTMRKWNPERAIELIARERIQRFGGVPSMAWQVMESPEFGKHDLSSVVGIGYGGAPSAPELVRRIKEAFPAATPSQGYGLTESSAIATNNVGVDYEQKAESAGPPVPVCDARVVDDEGRDVPTGQLGELWLRGPNIVKGYWNKPEATAATFGGGWLHTGDLVRVDEEGFVTILDRAKDMLIRGGENIYCIEVENALYEHPEVMDAAVIGIPHRVLGEEVGAVVQLTRGAKVTTEELRAWVAARLAGFKVPVRIDLRDQPLPRNANGKIMKRQIKEELGLA